MAEMQATRVDPGQVGRAASLAKVGNIMGALVSLALAAGIVTWGYRMVMRDVSGVPVVRALADPMREVPTEPGGREAAHQGLSVNRIAAQGATAAPPDRVIIAPPPLELTFDDIVRTPSRDRQDRAPDRAGDVHLAVAKQPAEMSLGATPAAPAPAAARTDAAVPRAQEADKAVSGGLGQSLRPRLRPAAPDPVAVALAAAMRTPPVEVDAAALPQGARLAQLGAFDSVEVARAEWDRLATRLGDLLDGKRRVVQRAESGGRVFYRLRAVGFDDLADARRFCSALQAERAECIPVVTR